MAYNTKPIVTDKDGNPISQYYNPDTDSYEPVEGSHGANKVMVENNNLSLILDKLSQLTGTVIDEETRKSNELERIDNEDIRIENENTRIKNENIRKANEQNRIELYNDLIDKVISGYFNGKNLEFHWRGTELGVRVEGDSEYIYVDLKGETGNIENLTMQHIINALGYTPIKSVNNIVADEAGNVELDIDAGEIENRIGNVEDDLETHKAESVYEGETHGLRITDGKLEYFDGENWKQIAGGSGSQVPLGNVVDFTAEPGDGKVILRWKDPDDIVVDGIIISKWAGTKILRKIGSYPANENDGVLVVDSGVRNQYAVEGFVDTGLENDIEYFYMAFPYTTDGVYTLDVANRVSATPRAQKIYGVRIDKNNSNPETRVTYIGDAEGFQPMRGNNGNFSWGSWKEVFESFEIRPCVLKNGVVQYYLNPNDFTKKADGSNSNLTGVDGDVMIEFGKTLWWKWTDEGDTYTIEISDKEFDGAVKHAFEIEEGYNLVPYYALLLTQILFVIFFKSTDSQTALGRGRVDGAIGYASTGGTDKKGMFYGSTNDEQMKFLGIEDYWGNKLWWIDGLVTDSNYNLLIGKGNFNDNGSDYQPFTSGFSSNTSGYIDSVQGGNEKGFIIKSGGGSATTYYADYGYLYSSRVARFGGFRSSNSYAGFTYLRLYHESSAAYVNVGARLFYASNGKIYIGAYLGTSESGKLRSISGTAEPTGNKTIGTFRTEARANN